MDQLPRIEADITFLPESEGGRKALPVRLSGGSYRPHIVVGDPKQRKSVMVGNVIQETYLAVAFLSGAEEIEPGKSFPAELCLIYYPHPDYEALIPNATFTVREGPKVVGYGQVKRVLTDNAT